MKFHFRFTKRMLKFRRNRTGCGKLKGEKIQRIFHIKDAICSDERAVKTTFFTTEATCGAVWIVKRGQVVAPHIHPGGDDVWICLSGRGVFYPSKGEEVPICAGDLIISKSGECHGMKNTGDEDFVFASVTAPIPSGYEAI